MVSTEQVIIYSGKEPMKSSVLLLLLCLLFACSTFVPVENLNIVSNDEKTAALKVKVFMLETASQYPPIAEVIGPVTAYSCKHLTTDAPASKGDALIRLRLVAVRKGADAVIDVTFDTRGTDTWGTNCWETVQASGTAVKLNQ